MYPSAGGRRRLPPGASFALVTGCQMAHTTCFAAALAQSPTQPTIVVLRAADLNIGAFDDSSALVPLAHADVERSAAAAARGLAQARANAR